MSGSRRPMPDARSLCYNFSILVIELFNFIWFYPLSDFPLFRFIGKDQDGGLYDNKNIKLESKNLLEKL